MGVNHRDVAARPIVVTDGETRTALACVRALGAAGWRVHVLATRAPGIAGASRFAAEVHRVPDAESEPREWCAAVARIARDTGCALVLPVTEVAMGSLLAFDACAALPVAAPPRGAWERVVDKHALLSEAAACGLAVPEGVLVEDPAGLPAAASALRLPVFVKSRRSRWLEDGRWRRGTARAAHDVEALRRMADEPAFRGGALVQETVPGRGEGLFCLVDQGTTRVRFAHRRLREKPPSGGVSVLSEAIAPDPALAEAGDRLFAELRWHGVAMLEVRRTPEGRAVVMEVNPRLWGSLQLAIDAGVDFPGLLVRLHRCEPLPAVVPAVGNRVRWLLGDLDRLWIAWRDPRQRAALGQSLPAAFLAFVRSFFDGTRAEVERLRDPAPAFRELREWLG